MRVRFLFLSIGLLATGMQAKAQTGAKSDTVIKGSTIEIVQSYKPEIKHTPKPELVPTLPPADTSKPVFKYNVPQQTLYYTYSSLPLRPLALGKDTEAVQFQNYVKLGAGNLSTVYIDAGIGSLKGKDYETAIQLHHISQQGDIKYQQSSLTDLEADGTLHRAGNLWHANIDAARNEYNYYGYNQARYDYGRDSVRQTFTSVHLGADMQKENEGIRTLNYHPAVTASIYGDKHNASETTFGINVPLTYNIDTSLQLKGAVNATITQLKTDAGNTGNNIAQLIAGLSYHKNGLYGHAYFAPTAGKNGGYFLPDLNVGYVIPQSQVTISAGWLAQLRQNTYEQLTTENPYIYNIYTVAQTKTDEVFANIDGNAGSHISFAGRVSWWHYNNLPTFLNNIGDQKQFYILYVNKENATSFQASVRYQIANTFAAGVSGTFYNFSTNTVAHVWHIPSARIKGDLIVYPIKKLSITAYLYMLDGIYGLDQNNNTIKLDPIFDIGGNATYQIIPRLSVFLQVNNLLNNKYERWMNYEGYGINIYGGLGLKF